MVIGVYNYGKIVCNDNSCENIDTPFYFDGQTVYLGDLVPKDWSCPDDKRTAFGNFDSGACQRIYDFVPNGITYSGVSRVQGEKASNVNPIL